MSNLIQDWEPWCFPFVPQSGKHAMDVGGNIGVWASGLSQRFQRVTSMEPVPAMVARIEGLKLPNVTVIQKAAWICAAQLAFNVYGKCQHGDGGWSTVADQDARAEQPVEQITVEGITIDSLGLDIDFMKMDIEGAEVPAILGALRTIGRCRPQVLIECHEPEHFAWCVAFLDRHGYNLTTINGPGYEPATHSWAKHRWLFGKYYK